MKRQAVVLAVLVLSACSTEGSKQVASTAAMGAALGIPAGPIGIAVGGVLGAAAGAVMPVGALQSQETDRDSNRDTN